MRRSAPPRTNQRRPTRLRASAPPPQAPESPRSEPTGPQKPGPRRLLGLSLLAIAAIAVAVYVWTAPLRAERALQTASLPELQTAARRDPNNPRPSYYLGLRLLQLGQPGPAEQAFRRAADLDSDDAKSWLGAAIAAAGHGDLQEGLGIAVAFAQRHPDNADAHFTIAQICAQQGSPQHAYTEALTATRLNPRDADAWRLAGEEALRLGKEPEAEQALRQARTQNPRDWHSALDLGDLLLRRGPSAEGTTCLEEATRLAPTEALPPLLLGKQLLQQAVTPAQIESARQALQQSAQIQANNAEVNHQLGIAEMRLGHPQAARDYLERAQDFAPADSAIVSDLLAADRLLQSTQAQEQETKRLQQLLAYQEQRHRLFDQIKANPGNPQPLRDLARLCAQNGDALQSDHAYHLLLAHAPDQKQAVQQEWEAVQSREAAESPLPVSSPEPTVLSADATPLRILLRDADTFLKQGKYDPAQRAYLSILARNPQTAAASVGLARVLDATGSPEQAVAYWEKAVRLDTKLWQAQFALAADYGRDNQYKEAADCYRQGLAVAPRDAEAWHALGALLAGVTDWYQEAEEALNRAEALQPNNAIFLRDLADLQAKRHESDPAEANYRRALQLSPQDTETQWKFAAFLIANRPAAALPEAGRLLALAAASMPNRSMIAYWQGRLALEQGNARRAIDLLLRAAPGLHRLDAVHLWYSLSRAYRIEGDSKRATAAQATADQARSRDQQVTVTENQLANDARNIALTEKLARLYAESGETEAALKQYQRLEYLEPEKEEVRREQAELETALKAHGSTSAQ